MTKQFQNQMYLNQESVRYTKQCKKFFLEDLEYIGYGIRVYTSTGYFDIDDLSKDEAAVEELVNYCNDGGLSLIHLEDVIEDFLS